MSNTRNLKEVIETVKVYKAKQAFLTAPERAALAGLADDDLVWVLREVTPFGTYSLEVKAVK
jgi:hypothetical protein